VHPNDERPPWAQARVRWLASTALMLSAAAAAAAPPAARFDLDTVAEKAQALAAASYEDPRGQVPDWLLKITYDQWRQIRFRPEEALWRAQKLPFQVQFFHPGLYYDHAVAVNFVDARGVHPLIFSPNQFDYAPNDFASRVPQDLGYAGFRLHYPIKTPAYHDEVIVFLGATYFRGVGKHEVFGLSARALAIDTAAPSGEEFPHFRAFWLMKPATGAKELTLYALLDSRSLAGAYRFVVRPGEQTVVDVDARLYLRRTVRKLGLAPLTSMFFHGENTPRPFEDFRPEVHDSDGLLVHAGTGEWLWRPLDNPRALHVSGLEIARLKGFGLLQRDRAFDHYQDLETRREQRPSAWIEPKGEWRDGVVELVEIPTQSDVNDNIVAYWVAKQPNAPGTPVTAAYRLHWFGEDPTRSPGGRVSSTRRAPGTAEDAHRFLVEFEGPQLAKIPGERVLRGVVTVVGGAEVAELLDQQVIKNPITGGWRLTFQVRPKENDPIELRAYLDEGGQTLTETWSYVILP
jgi:glucans biosynthesis protein